MPRNPVPEGPDESQLLSMLFEDAARQRPVQPVVGQVFCAYDGYKPLSLWARRLGHSYTVETEIDGSISNVPCPKVINICKGANKRGVTYRCTSAGCPWMLTCAFGKLRKWTVTKVNNQHIGCHANAIHYSAADIADITIASVPNNAMLPTLTNSVISGIIDGRVAQAYTPATIHNSKKIMALKTQEPFSLGFTLIESYLHQLLDSNPHSILCLQHTIDSSGLHRFARLFVMLNATVNVVRHACRPVVSFDCAFMKCKSWGTNFQLMLAGNYYLKLLC